MAATHSTGVETMWYWHDGVGWWMMFGGIWMLIFWGAVIALVVWSIKKLTERSSAGSGNQQKHSPLDIAKERYAKGEISKDEFEQIKKDLS
jgi:putative membrane protein